MRAVPAVLFVVLALTPGSLSALTRLVTVAGVDVGDCTVAPCATLTYAIGQAVDFDLIDVGPGTFNNGGVAVNVTKTLRLEGNQAGVDARGRVGAESIITAPIILAKNNITFIGFTVNCGACAPIGAGITTSASFTGYELFGNIVTGNPIGVYPGSTGVRMLQNHITENNNGLGVLAAAGTGIYTDTGVTVLIINDNWIDGHQTANINIIGTALAKATADIQRNVFAQDVIDDANAIVLFDTSGVLIENNVMTGGTASTIFVGGGNDDLIIVRNSMTGSTSSAISITDSFPGPNDSILIRINNIANNLRGINITASAPMSPVLLNFNRLEDNGTDVRVTVAGVTVNGEGNWWGCNEGPAVCATNSIDAGSTADFDPWILMNITAFPDHITMQQTSFVIADFYANSSLEFPGDIPIAFTATGGTMNPTSDTTAAATADSVFMPSAPGNAQAHATLDDETVSAPIVVTAVATTTTLMSNNNPSDFGENVTFTATISDNTATGTVEFFDGATSLGVVAVVGGVAQLTTSILAVGFHLITAVYSGDVTFDGSTSNAVTQVVNAVPAGAAIPTLPAPMLAVLAALLAVAAVVVLRR